MLRPDPAGPEQEAPDAPAPRVGVRAQEAALSDDGPLPTDYQRDQIKLMIQGPARLYLYWRFAHDPAVALQRLFGARAAHFRLAIKLVDVESGAEAYHDATPSGEYWFNELRPGRRYRAEVGQLAPGDPFITLLRSEEIGTPRAGVASVAESAPPAAHAHAGTTFSAAPAAPGVQETASALTPAADADATHARATHMNYAAGLLTSEPPEVF
jgi:hypothetical protein